MNQLNSNIDNRYRLIQQNPNFQAQAEVQAMPNVQIPDIYYTPNDSFQQQSFKESVKQADMMGLVYPWLAHPLLMLGTCTGLAYGVDKFSKACGGEYEHSLVGKAAKLGDNIQNSSFVQSNPVQTVLGWGKTGKSKIGHFFRNSDVLNAIRKTPSMPEWGIVKDEMLGQEQRIVHEFTRITDALKLNSTETSALKDIGLNKAEREFLKSAKIPSEHAVNTILLKRLGRSDAEINRIIGLGNGATQAVKNEILKDLGLTSDKLDLIKKDSTGKYIGEVKSAVEKVKGRVRIGAGHYNFLGKFQPFERSIGCDEVYNRLHSVSDGAKTATGKFMSKFLQKLHRGFTFGGGKLGVLAFVSPLLVETMLDTKKADPDQKIGTVAHGLVEAVSWVFTFPLALKIMHSLTGAQYAGMTKDQVEKCREIKKKFNETKFSSYDEYNKELKIAKEKIKNLEKVDGQNLLTKVCRKLGKFVTMDLERFKSYRNGNPVMNMLRKSGGFFKNLGGVPMRLGIWGVLSMGLLSGAINKGTKAIFGNYYDRYKEEEYENNKKKQKEFLKEDLQTRLLEAQQRKVLANTNQTAEANAPINNIAEINEQNIPTAIPQTTPQETFTPGNKQTQTAPIQQAPIPEVKTLKRDNYTYIPSSENILRPQQNNSQINKYIPSQNAENFIKTFDNSGLEPALRRADRAEQRAIQTLAGKFKGQN